MVIGYTCPPSLYRAIEYDVTYNHVMSSCQKEQSTPFAIKLTVPSQGLCT